jgi:arginyl-tRNA synthetase
VFYKKAKAKFDADPEFKKRSQKAVVSLQGGEEKYVLAWRQICNISRREFNVVYERLHVTLEEKGESFYHPYIAGVLKELEEKNLIEESEGARVITVPGHTIPLLVVKGDGGFNYASTDLSALWYVLIIVIWMTEEPVQLSRSDFSASVHLLSVSCIVARRHVGLVLFKPAQCS